MRHALQDAFDRVERAAVHIEEFKARERDLGQRYHDALKIEYDTREPPRQKFTPGGIVVDSMFGILLGEAVYNLRGALDYLVFQLAKKDSGAEKEKTQFPICDDAKRFSDLRPRFLNGVNASHQDSIEALQPYAGCHWTPVIRDISNPDKHCKLSDNIFGFNIRTSTNAFPKRAGGGSLAPVFHSKRKVFHPEFGTEIDVYLSTEVPIIVELGGKPKAVANELDEAKERVVETLEFFKPDILR